MKVAIVGGGIVGLSTALNLKNEFRDSKITIIASSFEDTTSHVAAGIFRVASSFSGPTDEITWKWIKDSYEYYDDIRKTEEAALAGITNVSGYIFAKSSPYAIKNQWMEKLLPIYRKVTPEELKLVEGGWKYGSFFMTILNETSLHLPWARQKLILNGTVLVEKTVNSLKEITKNFDLVINCSGLGARELCNDRHLVPIRGQVTKVKAPWIKTFFYGENDTYIIPGFNGICTLGGVRAFDSENREFCPHDAASIRERCVKLIPSLSKAEVVRHMTGLRPHREGNVRVELEKISDEFSSKMVVHNYGHGGYGVSTAPGTAKYAVELAKETRRMSSKL
ncbi:D-aspartate oxidase [Belonocnema kinseyi]|uniref:D-aspartate oxidase n=1 Tax=Belonocnema kinseyi TaxID=2817044 RepID=UPI00143DB3A8|nr:D-aspartate oxidase [Belonocnema kinseyi]